MLIECVENRTFLIANWSKSATPVEELLKIGNIYNVYGLYFNKEISYEILLNEFDNHTIELPAHMFKVLDNRLSSFFALGLSERWSNLGNEKKNIQKIPFISFPEWANDESFFDNLVDGNKETEHIFNMYKETLYLEYRHPSITKLAIYLQDNWVQCPICTNYWELEYPAFEMCRCTKCNEVLLIPN